MLDKRLPQPACGQHELVMDVPDALKLGQMQAGTLGGSQRTHLLVLPIKNVSVCSWPQTPSGRAALSAAHASCLCTRVCEPVAELVHTMHGMRFLCFAQPPEATAQAQRG